MKKIIFFTIFYLLILNLQVFPQGKGHGIEVRITSSKIVETEPGRIITASFLVSNNTEQDEELLENIGLPEGWQKIVSQEFPFTLKTKEKEVRILAIFIPFSAVPGSYEITYSVRSRRDYGITDTDTFKVIVLPLVKIEILSEEIPESVVAGDLFDIKLRLINRGNAKTKIKLETKSNYEWPIKIEPAEIFIDAGQFLVLKLTVATDNKIEKEITYILTVKAETEKFKNGIVSVQKTFSVKIIPRITGRFDPYHRLPSQLSIIGVGSEQGGGIQVEFSGGGTLDEEGSKRINFLFRGPDLQNKSTFGNRDEYWLSYYDNGWDFHLGDRSYSLSPLTERYMYGRGLEINIHPEKFRIGGFILESRWVEPERTEAGFYIEHHFNDWLSLRGNLLMKENGFDDKLYSFQAGINPNRNFNLQMEYGFSKREDIEDNAYRIDLSGEMGNKMWYSFEKIYAGPQYFGYYSDTDIIYGDIIFPVYGNLRGKFSYRKYANNLELNPAKPTAPREEDYMGGFTYSFPTKTYLSLFYENNFRKDALFPSEYDYEENIVNLGFGHTFKKGSLHASIERGSFKNNLTGETNDNLGRYRFYAYFYPNQRQTYGIYVTTGHTLFSEDPERKTSAGISCSWAIKDNLRINLDFQKNGFDSEEGEKQDRIYASLSYTLPNGHILSLRSLWYKYEEMGEKIFSVFLAYTIPLKIPVSKKRNIGILKGRIYDAENPKKPGLAGVILRVNNSTAVSDASGEFIFPDLAPGTYFLTVEKKSIGIKYVTLEKTPMKVEIVGGKTTEVEIGVVRSGTIFGRVVILKYGNNNNHGNKKETSGLYIIGSGMSNNNGKMEKDNPVEVKGLGGILVEIKNGKEVLRQITDENGNFSFTDLRPGHWILKVYDYNLPSQHYFEKEEFEFELNPDEKKEITIRVLPRSRPIQILEKGEIKQ